MTAEFDAEILPAIPRYRWTADQAVEGVSLEGKNIIVTGGTSGIGIPTVVALARTGANVYFTARDAAKAAPVLAETKATTGNDNVAVLPLDLTSYKSVLEFVALWGSKPVDVLLHNAGVVEGTFGLTQDGDAVDQQVNFFSIVLLTEKLRPLLAPHARVVIVSSLMHRFIPSADFKALFEQYALRPAPSKYQFMESYAVSKSLAIAYSNVLNAEFVKAGLTARSYSLHPGVIVTDVSRSLSHEQRQGIGTVDKDGKFQQQPFYKTQEQGASTSVWAAVSSELSGKGGLYLEHCAVTPKDQLGAALNDAAAPAYARHSGTAPHVWDVALTEEIVAASRAHLKSKKVL